MLATEYLPRLADPQLAALLNDLPAVMVTGPRAAGKTTSARRLAAETLRLDDPAVAAAVAANRCSWISGRKCPRCSAR